jgi:hypothetical protein
MTLKEILEFLNGKKTYLALTASAFNVYFLAVGVFSPELGVLVQSLTTIFFGGAKYQSDVLGIGK